MNYEDLQKFEYYEQQEQKHMELLSVSWLALKIIIVVLIALRILGII